MNSIPDDFASDSKGNQWLTNINTPRPIKKIGYQAFANCKSLTTVAMNDSKVTNIMDKAFVGCDALSNITLPDTLEVIGIGCFFNCRSIKKIDLPDSLTEIRVLAFGQSGLEHIVIPENVTYIGLSAFDKCRSLQSVDMSACQVPNVRGELFMDCTNLTEVKLPNIRYIEPNAFYNCISLKELFLPKSVSKISSRAFDRGCSELIIKFEGSEDDWRKVLGSDDVNKQVKQVLFNQ